MRRHDVVVVGAGASGCSIAAHLLRERPDARVAIVDRAHVGAGSTSRSTAAFRHQWSVPAHVAFSRYAAREFAALAARGVPVGFRRNGYLFLHPDADAARAARDRVAMQRAAGVRGVEVLDRDETRRRVAIGPALDPDSFVASTWGPDDGFLDPLALAQGYLDEARQRGADYLPGRTVRAVMRSGGRVAGVHAEPVDLAADVVVLAAGVWSATIGADSGLPLPLRAAKRHLYHARPVRGRDVSRWPLTIGDRGQHVRPSEANTLLLAWERRPAPLPALPSDAELRDGQDRPDPGFGIDVDAYGGETLAAMARHVPCLAEDTALHRVTCGWYAVTPDHKAILGDDPRCPGLIHACGFSGHGIMHAPATGAVVAARILDRRPDWIDVDEIERQFGLAPLLDGRAREPLETLVL